MTTLILHVYDLHPLNSYVRVLGFGAFHTGVEFNGIEYAFGKTQSETTGVARLEPKVSHPGFRQSYMLGKCSFSTFTSALKRLQEEFIGTEYHIINRNCNHFSQALAMACLGQPIPPFINRGAKMLSFCCGGMLMRSQQPMAQERRNFEGKGVCMQQ